MLPRNRPGAPKPPEPEAVPGPVEIVEMRELDFSFGPGDSYGYTLGPKDSFFQSPGSTTHRVLLFEDGERVEIDMTKVRLFSDRKRKVTRALAPFTPPDPASV